MNKKKVIADQRAELAQAKDQLLCLQQQLEEEPDKLLQARLKAEIADLKAQSAHFEDLVKWNTPWSPTLIMKLF